MNPMKNKSSKKDVEKKIEDFFKNIKNKDSESIRKIKRLAMHYHIRLKDKRKKFCQKCFSTSLRTKKIKNRMKLVECENCKKIYRWKVKTKTS